MTPYSSNSGKSSGVIAYKSGKDFIIVKFKTGEEYTYSYRSAGKPAIEEMKKRALAGKELSTYISQNQPGFD